MADSGIHPHLCCSIFLAAVGCTWFLAGTVLSTAPAFCGYLVLVPEDVECSQIIEGSGLEMVPKEGGEPSWSPGSRLDGFVGRDSFGKSRRLSHLQIG